MTNLLNLPYDSNTKVFFVNGDDFQVWEKPNGAKLIHIICIGGGAGVKRWQKNIFQLVMKYIS